MYENKIDEDRRDYRDAAEDQTLFPGQCSFDYRHLCKQVGDAGENETHGTEQQHVQEHEDNGEDDLQGKCCLLPGLAYGCAGFPFHQIRDQIRKQQSEAEKHDEDPDELGHEGRPYITIHRRAHPAFEVDAREVEIDAERQEYCARNQ